MPPSSTSWFSMLSDCLAAAEREQSGSPAPVVDHEIVIPPGGGPDEMVVWCICRTVVEKRQFADTEQTRFVAGLKRRLLTAGFPEEALASLTIRTACRAEMAGGMTPR